MYDRVMYNNFIQLRFASLTHAKGVESS